MSLKTIFDHILFAILSIVSRFTPRSRKKWVYTAGNGKRFAENSKYLYLNNINADDGIKHIWIGTSGVLVEELKSADLRAYSLHSIRGKYHLLTAGIAVETHGPQLGQYLGGATIIDTHHGNALKLMGDDELAADTQDWVSSIKQWIWNKLVTVSYFQVTNEGIPKVTFQKAKNLADSEILVAPYPRLDPFFGHNSLFKIVTNTNMLNKIQNQSDKKDIVVYAPTWREAFDKQNGSPLTDILPNFRDIDRLLEQTGAVMYVSTHPREPIEIDFGKYENIFDFNTGGDMYPYLPYCDILVTDYSSIFYDFLFTNQPICFYAPDLIEYRSSRGLYFEYAEHVPGPISESTSELIDDLELALTGKDNYSKKRAERLCEFYTVPDRKPSENTRKEIMDTI